MARFGEITMDTITSLVTLLAIWSCDLSTCLALDDNRPVDPVQFLLTEGQVIDKVVPLPYDINLHCELILGIEIEPFVPQKPDEYEDYDEGSGNDIDPAPAREAGEVLFTLQHPNFEGGEEEVIVSVDEKGNGLEKKTMCFIECVNITGHKAFTLSATTDIKSTVDVKLVQKVGNHICQITDNTNTSSNDNNLAKLAIPFICTTVILFIITIILLTYICWSKLTQQPHELTTVEEKELLDLNAKPTDTTGDLDTDVKSGKPEKSSSAPGSGRNQTRGVSVEKQPQPVGGIEKDTENTTKRSDTLAPQTETWNNCWRRLREKHMILLIASLSCTFVFAVLSVLSLI